jgi:hypothetical protein
VRLKGTNDDEGFATTAPCKTKILLRSVAWVATVEGVDDMEGAWEAEGVIEERAPKDVAALDGVVGVEQGVKEVFIFVIQ